ncbi:unnamed protein product [Cyclocybe aegerita]|uniref:CBM1 domain-containing protein n=1 Tax=Cyclocybe aegerita TaxID=1973307 RepID=A0A8S0VTH4_CYCAE|nr:unnamed protein product [Cyclocybe aegerita]
MDSRNDLAKLSTCTTCQFKENKSNYWTAVLYFRHNNGSFIRVPQMANQGTGTPNGGMTIYYVQNGLRVTAPPRGFRMITGNPMLRSKDTNVPNKVTSFRCFGANFQDSNGSQPPGGGTDTVEFPTKFCAGGIRANTYFPQCWDGVNLDSPDHQSHVAHPIGQPDPYTGLSIYGGTCPSTHPVRLPMLFFETVWDTRPFRDIWPTDGRQPLVFSMGDPTGYGHHGDYVFGWEGDALQRAMDSCTEFNGVPSYCTALTVQSDAEINRCTQTSRVAEVVEGRYLDTLPGCNPIQNGPADATMPANCAAASTIAGPVPTVVPAPGTTQAQPPVVTPAPPPPPAPTTAPVPNAPQQAHYGQCGGQGWTGPTVCQAPYTCTFSNQWYSQCL